MEFKFTDWYTQALGATLGILACIYSYVNGDMIIYSNLATLFDTLEFGGIISSYLLLPLCMTTLALAVFLSFYDKKSVCNVSLKSFNTSMIILTVIVGFLGTSIYFVIPTVFLVFNLKAYLFNNSTISEEDEHNEEVKSYEIIKSKELETYSEADVNITRENINDDTIVFKGKNILVNECSVTTSKDKNIATKIQMAKELLIKNASKQFITEVTGLTFMDIEEIEYQLNSKDEKC